MKHANRLPSNWKTWRRIIFSRDGYMCTQCGSPRNLQVDHKIARKDGGRHTHENLITLCGDCHARKTAREAAKGPRGQRKPQNEHIAGLRAMLHENPKTSPRRANIQ